MTFRTYIKLLPLSAALCGVAAALCGVAVAQQDNASKLTARELFYSAPAAAKPAAGQGRPGGRPVSPPAKPGAQNKPAANPPVVEPHETQETRSPARILNASAAGLAPLGLKYKLLRSSASEPFEEADPDSTFRNGDKLRLIVEANAPAYLYIVARGTSGSWDVLFPNKDVDEGDNRVKKMTEYVLPGGKSGQWSFYGAAGEEKLFLVLSRKPEKNFDDLIYRLSDGGRTAAAEKEESQKRPMQIASRIGSIDDQLIGRVRNDVRARDLVFEKVDEKTTDTTDKKEKAVYIVNTASSAEAQLFVDLSLKHR